MTRAEADALLDRERRLLGGDAVPTLLHWGAAGPVKTIVFERKLDMGSHRGEGSAMVERRYAVFLDGRVYSLTSGIVSTSHIRGTVSA